jgi:antitoxin (DNA-binding transcriptional repressor) of toxin-antitoxin stability system
VDRAAAGEEIIIAKAGKPKAKLVPYQPARKKRRFGQNLLGITYIADDFDRPLPPELFRVGSTGRIRWRSNPCRRSTRHRPDIDLFR